jgi:hypothetical protein
VPAGRFFREAIKHIIETEDSLDVLNCHGLRRKSSLPSWVPGFAALSRAPAGILSAPFSLVAVGDNKARVSGDRRPNIYMSQDVMTLRADGFCFDVVEEVIDLKHQIMDQAAAPDETVTELASTMHSIKSRARAFRRQITPTDPRRFLNEPGFDFLLKKKSLFTTRSNEARSR